jgi:flavin reductase
MIDLKNAFRLGMRRLAAGVSIVTTVHRGRPYGFVATSVTSVSVDPDPCLLVCVNQSVSSHDRLLDAGVFCVNFLAHEDRDLARRFSSSAHRGERFDDADWAAMTTGAPAYKGAMASLDCECRQASWCRRTRSSSAR